jgi:glycosyltransferase involved in cell wall biosynthesis
MIERLFGKFLRALRRDKTRRRSVVFLHNCYYNFFYLAAALRKRGWNAIVVNVDPPDNADSKFFHGDDLNLWHPDPKEYQKKIERFLKRVKRDYKMVHFYSIGRMSFFPQYWDTDDQRTKLPVDFIELKKLGVKIGYSHSGCLDLVSQSEFLRWSGGACNKCVWQLRPDVCSNLRNLSWGKKVQTYCDLICTETDPVMDFKSGPKVFREPLTFALDPKVWSENLSIPSHLKLERTSEEVLIYHAVGNLKIREASGRNIKGSPAIVKAIDELRQEGLKVRLHFVTDVPSIDVRFIQAQCDVIIDQLNYGRYGATAREGMMLGKPVVCNINKTELRAEFESECINETPLIHATEGTIKEVLRKLVVDSEFRREMGKRSREHAMKWWSADRLAERYEAVYDKIMNGETVSELPYMVQLPNHKNDSHHSST